jgi:hypothetical protein
MITILLLFILVHHGNKTVFYYTYLNINVGVKKKIGFKWFFAG